MNTHLVAGAGGGIITTVVLHPLDLVKVRYQMYVQAHTGVQRTMLATIRSIVAKEGVGGLWNGYRPAMLASGVTWGLYFYNYEHAKARYKDGTHPLASLAGGPGPSRPADSAPLAPWQHMLAACEGGAKTVLVTHPLWLIKTRLQLQPTTGEGLTAYKSGTDAFVSIVRHEGIRGLYKGLIPALILVTHGAIQFSIYEKLKELFTPEGFVASSAAFFAMGAVSKAAAATITYPYQVIKTRRQAVYDGGPPYKGTIDCFRRMMREEGWQAFTRGLAPTVARVIPASAMTLMSYEAIKKVLGDSQGR